MASPRQAAAVLGVLVSVLLAAVLWRVLAAPAGAPGALAAGAGAEPPDPGPSPSAVLAAPHREPEAEAEPERGPELAAEPGPPAPTPARPATAERPREVVGPPRTVLRGRVETEGAGAGLADCVARVRADGADLAAAVTGDDGRFEVAVRHEGPVELVVLAPDGWLVREAGRALHLAPGVAHPEQVFVAERWPPEPAGDVAGRLVSENGPWTESPLSASGSITLDLVSTVPPKILRSTRPVVERGEDGSFGVTFRFEDVPRGEYELTLSDLSHFRWSPGSLFLSPPAENLELVRLDGDRTVRLAFRVTDAETGEPVEGWRAYRIGQSVSAESGVLMHVGPLDLEGFPVDSRLDWAVRAEGYAAAYGDERAFRIESAELWVADVRLRPGWSTRLVVIGRDPTMRPLAGAVVYLDGDEVGSTDDAGGLDVFRDEPPEELRVVYRDLVVDGDPLAGARGVASSGRGQVTMVEMVRPR